MSDAYLRPPGRFSHGLLLVVGLLIAVGIAMSIGQQPTLYLGLITTAVFVVGFWAFSQRTMWLTATGTVAVLLGALGILLTALWALVGSMAAAGGLGWIVSLGVILALIAGIVAIVGHIVPATVTEQDGPTIVALLYGVGIALVAAVGITSVQLGLAGLFGASTSSLIDTGSELFFRSAALNPVTQAGSIALLGGVCFWYLIRLTQLPAGRQLSRGLAIRLHHRLDVPRAGESTSGGDASAGSGHDQFSVSDVLGFGSWLPKILRLSGAVLFSLGLVTLAVGLTPEFQSTATTHPMARTMGSILGPSAALQRSMAMLLLGLIGLRLAHAVFWRVLTIDWAAYGHRLGYVSGSVVVMLAAGGAGRPIVEFLLRTPALKFVPTTDAGPPVVPTESGLRLAESGLAGLELSNRPELFDSWFPAVVSLTGPAAVGIWLLAVALALAILVLVVATIFAGGARLTRPGAGIGLLFVGAVGATSIGAGELLALLAGAGALLAWELYTYGAGLHRQLDPQATTLTAEIVHLGVSVLLIGIAIGVTLLATRATRILPAPQSQWQLIMGLGLSVAALMLGLIYLGLLADKTPEPTDSSVP